MIDDDAIRITEYAIAKLEIRDRDVLIVQVQEEMSPEQRAYLQYQINSYAEDRGTPFHTLVMQREWIISVVSADDITVQK